MLNKQKESCPTLIPYMGGKFQLSKQFVPMIPTHDRYIEVFAGGLSMFFRKAKVEINVLNDKEKNLVNLYMCVAEKFDEFNEYCKWYVNSREMFTIFKKQITDKEPFNIPDPKRAARYYYCVRCAFNHNLINPFGKISSNWNRELLNDLEETRSKLDNILFENMDFRDLYKKYPSKKNDFWYLDPPYVVATERGDYYLEQFSEKDHEDLVEICKDIDSKGAKFMVSYDDRKTVEESFKDFNIIKIPVIYSGQQHKRDYKNELVIINYDPPNVQKSLF